MPHLVHARKYLPTKHRAYCVTNKEQQDLAKKFPNTNVQLSLDGLCAYLEQNPDKLPKTANKTKELIVWWFSGASATR